MSKEGLAQDQDAAGTELVEAATILQVTWQQSTMKHVDDGSPTLPRTWTALWFMSVDRDFCSDEGRDE